MNGTDNLEGLEPGLYIVATPIGNLGDITLRAVDILRRCDAVACEDTRVTGKLLKHLDISKPLWRYDDHASDAAREGLLAAMQRQAVVLVSDAGTPLISDPGYRLVREARERQLPVTSLPGPSAVTVALSACGLPTDRFMFGGFLPAKEQARKHVLEELGNIRTTLVFFETGARILRTLAQIEDLFPGRKVVVARELTKFYENFHAGTAGELYGEFEAAPPKGEIVLLLEPPIEIKTDDIDVDGLLSSLLAHEKPAKAAADAARMTGMDRKLLYKRIMGLKQSEQERS